MPADGYRPSLLLSVLCHGLSIGPQRELLSEAVVRGSPLTPGFRSAVKTLHYTSGNIAAGLMALWNLPDRYVVSPDNIRPRW